MHELAWGLCLVFAVGCGATLAPIDAGADAAPKDATTADVLGFGDAGGKLDANLVALDGGGPFLCNDCICDGVSNMCEHFSGGKMPLDQDGGIADASACQPDAGQSYCAPLPSDCATTPTCACILKHEPPGCMCDLDPSGDGLVLSCQFP